MGAAILLFSLASVASSARPLPCCPDGKICRGIPCSMMGKFGHKNLEQFGRENLPPFGRENLPPFGRENLPPFGRASLEVEQQAERQLPCQEQGTCGRAYLEVEQQTERQLPCGKGCFGRANLEEEEHVVQNLA